MEVIITNKKILKAPHLEIDLGLEQGSVHIKLTYTCDKCSGYGCGNHGGPSCDDHVILKPENVMDTLGESARPLLEKIFAQILNRNT